MSVPRRDRELTPHKVAVVLLIEKYGCQRPVFWGSDIDSTIHPLMTLTPRERKATCVLVSNLIQGSDLSLSDLLELVKSYPLSPQHVKAFMAGLEEINCKGLEMFLMLFDSIEKFACHDQNRGDLYPCLWTSVVGLYLRQINLAFRRLSFSQVVSLYEKFRAYYEECFKDQPSKLEDTSSSEVKNAANEEKDLAPNPGMNVSDMDMEQTSPESSRAASSVHISGIKPLKLSDLLDMDCEDYAPATDANEDAPLPSMDVNHQQAELFIRHQTSLLSLKDPRVLAPKKLQLRLAEIMKKCPDLGQGHYLGYLNCLRVYEFAGALHSLVRSYDSKLLHRDPGKSDEVTRTFRYAALNMAALHAHFGHRELGLLHLQEALMMAQETGDHVCLQFALAWLYCLAPSQKARLMRRSYVKSSEISLGYLSWLGILSYTALLGKTTVAPSVIIKKVLNAPFLVSGAKPVPECGVQGQAGIWGIQQALWAAWGNVPVSSICSQLVLHISSHSAMPLQAPSMTSPICSSLCNVALTLAAEGDCGLANDVLQFAKSQYPSPWEPSKLWTFAKTYISITFCLFQGDLGQAHHIVASMATTYPAHAQYWKAKLLTLKGEYVQAIKLLVKQRESPEVNEDPVLYVQCMILEAEALALGGNLGASLSLLVKAIAGAKSYHLAFLTALGQLYLATVQLHLGFLREAQKSFNDGIDVVLAGGSVMDRSSALLLQVKLEVASARGITRKAQILQAVENLKKAQDLFSKVNAKHRIKEIVYLKTRLYHELGQVEQRNKCALEFRQLEQQNSSHIGSVVMYLF